MLRRNIADGKLIARMRQDEAMRNGRDDATFTGADRTSNGIRTGR
jgi:hypothetical protein